MKTFRTLLEPLLGSSLCFSNHSFQYLCEQLLTHPTRWIKSSKRDSRNFRQCTGALPKYWRQMASAGWITAEAKYGTTDRGWSRNSNPDSGQGRRVHKRRAPASAAAGPRPSRRPPDRAHSTCRPLGLAQTPAAVGRSPRQYEHPPQPGYQLARSCTTPHFY